MPLQARHIIVSARHSAAFESAASHYMGITSAAGSRFEPRMARGRRLKLEAQRSQEVSDAFLPRGGEPALASPTLATAIVERLAEGEASFHVVVPATPIQHGLTWDEAEARAAAQARLEQVLVRLKDLGATASEVGSADPVSAAVDALRDHPVDEIILSTLPVGISAGSVSMSRRVSSEPWQCR